MVRQACPERSRRAHHERYWACLFSGFVAPAASGHGGLPLKSACRCPGMHEPRGMQTHNRNNKGRRVALPSLSLPPQPRLNHGEQHRMELL